MPTTREVDRTFLHDWRNKFKAHTLVNGKYLPVSHIQAPYYYRGEDDDTELVVCVPDPRQPLNTVSVRYTEKTKLVVLEESLETTGAKS